MSVTITFVDGEAYPRDLAHAWQGLIGGRYARGWRAWLDGATLRVVSFAQGGSGADPRDFVAELASAEWAEADLGSGDVTGDDVAAAFVAAAATLGSTWVQDGAEVSSASASDPGVEPTTWDERGDVRVHGVRRDYGALDGSTDNGPIGGTVGGHTPSPGAGYRVIAIMGRADGGNATRLWAASGPAYATNPGAMTPIAEAVETIDNNAIAIAPLPAAAAVPDDDLWLGMRAIAAQLLRFRYPGQNPVGRGDFGAAEEIFLDTAEDDPTVALGAGFDPGNGGGNYGLFPHVAVVLEAAPYWADGTITAMVVGLHNDHDASVQAPGPTSTLPADMAHETVSLRTVTPPWPAELVAVEVAIAAADAGVEDMGGAIYSWSDLDYPASTPPALLRDLGPLGIVAAGWHHVDVSPPLEVDDEIVSLTLVCGELDGGAAATLSLLYDEDIGNTQVYPTSWLDGVERNDHVAYMGGLGIVAEYTTRDDAVPPSPNEVADPTIVWPATLAITSSDGQPRNLPRIRYVYAHRDAIAVEYASAPSGEAGGSVVAFDEGASPMQADLAIKLYDDAGNGTATQTPGPVTISAEDTILVAAVAGRRVLCVGGMLSMADAVTLTFYSGNPASGGSAITGAIPLAAGQLLPLGAWIPPTAVGAALYVRRGTAVSGGGAVHAVAL